MGSIERAANAGGRLVEGDGGEGGDREGEGGYEAEVGRSGPRDGKGAITCVVWLRKEEGEAEPLAGRHARFELRDLGSFERVWPLLLFAWERILSIRSYLVATIKRSPEAPQSSSPNAGAPCQNPIMIAPPPN